MENIELTVRTSEEAEGQQWGIVKEEKESYTGNNKQHIDDVFKLSLVISEWLSCWLKVFEYKEMIIVNKMKMFQVVVEAEIDTSFQNLIMLTSMLFGAGFAAMSRTMYATISKVVSRVMS